MKNKSLRQVIPNVKNDDVPLSKSQNYLFNKSSKRNSLPNFKKTHNFIIKSNNPSNNESQNSSSLYYSDIDNEESFNSPSNSPKKLKSNDTSKALITKKDLHHKFNSSLHKVSPIKKTPKKFPKKTPQKNKNETVKIKPFLPKDEKVHKKFKLAKLEPLSKTTTNFLRKGRSYLNILNDSERNFDLSKNNSFVKVDSLPNILTIDLEEKNDNLEKKKINFDENENNEVLDENNEVLDENKDNFERNDVKESDDMPDIDKLNDVSFDKVPEDEKDKEFIGEKALENYYHHYKDLEKIKQQNEFNSIENSLFTEILTNAQDKNALPKSFGIVKKKGAENELNIANNILTEEGAEIISKSLKGIKNLTTINMSNANIKEKQTDIFFKRATKQAKIIDISKNQIGKAGIESLSGILSSNRCSLIELNLEANKLTDYVIISLLNVLKENGLLKRLNLSNNNISNQSCEKIKDLLTINYSIQELYLHWNKISGDGGELIFSGLINNSFLTVLDLSWNKLGNTNKKCSENLGKCLVNPKSSLVHLDISYNNFNETESITISKYLKNNFTLFGIHYQGNCGYIDEKGFLIVKVENKENAAFDRFNSKKRINGVKPLSKEMQKVNQNFNYQDNCWLCSGWQEIAFVWTYNSKKHAFKPEKVYVHVDKLNYKGEKMEQIYSSCFMKKLMCPLGIVKFFFTVDGIQLLSDCPTVENKDPYIENVVIDNNSFGVMMSTLNYINVDYEREILMPDKYLPTISSRPRMISKIPEEEKKAKGELDDLIFRKFLNDDKKEYLDKCLQKDLELSKVFKIIKSPEMQEKVKLILQKHYKIIKTAYKYLVFINPVGNIFGITPNIFTDFINKTGLFNKNFKLVDMDLTFISTTSAKSQKIFRHHFVEILVRIAEERFVKSNEIASIDKAIDKMLNAFINPIAREYEHNNWRKNRLFNKDCDKVIITYWNMLQAIYKMYAGSLIKSSNLNKQLWLKEFKKLMGDLNLIDADYTERDVNLAFGFSTNLFVDEITQDRHLQLTFLSFVEALARSGEKLSFLPLGYKESENWSLQVKLSMPLCLKIESFFEYISDKLIDKNNNTENKKSIFEKMINYYNSFGTIKHQAPVHDDEIIETKKKGVVIQKFRNSITLSKVLNRLTSDPAIMQLDEKELEKEFEKNLENNEIKEHEDTEIVIDKKF